MAGAQKICWYALKVFFNRVELLRNEFTERGFETFAPRYLVKNEERPVIPSLLFVRCTEGFLQELKHEKWDAFMFYPSADNRAVPGAIPEHEFEIFRLATSALVEGAEYLGSDTERYMVGDKVRVMEGPYRGYEGYIRRIKHDRKLLVCLEGIAVMAFSNIRPENVEKIL